MTDLAQRFIKDTDHSGYHENTPVLVTLQDRIDHRLYYHQEPQGASPAGLRGSDRRGDECLGNGGKHLPDLQLDCLKELHEKNSNKAPDEVRRFEHEASRQRQDAENNRINEIKAKVDNLVENQVAQANENMAAKIVAGAARGQDSVAVYKLPDIDTKEMEIQVYDTRRPRLWQNDSPLPAVLFDKEGNCTGNDYANRQAGIWSVEVECKREIAQQSGDTKTLESIAAEIDPSYVRALRPAEKELWNELDAKGLKPFFVQRGDDTRHIYVRIP